MWKPRTPDTNEPVERSDGFENEVSDSSDEGEKESSLVSKHASDIAGIEVMAEEYWLEPGERPIEFDETPNNEEEDHPLSKKKKILIGVGVGATLIVLIVISLFWGMLSAQYSEEKRAELSEKKNLIENVNDISEKIQESSSSGVYSDSSLPQDSLLRQENRPESSDASALHAFSVKIENSQWKSGDLPYILKVSKDDGSASDIFFIVNQDNPVATMALPYGSWKIETIAAPFDDKRVLTKSSSHVNAVDGSAVLSCGEQSLKDVSEKDLDSSISVYVERLVKSETDLFSIKKKLMESISAALDPDENQNENQNGDQIGNENEEANPDPVGTPRD